MHLFHTEYRHFVIWQAFGIFHMECVWIHPSARALHSTRNTLLGGTTTKADIGIDLFLAILRKWQANVPPL